MYNFVGFLTIALLFEYFVIINIILGARLGQMQSMAGLAAVLHKYTVEPAACSEENPLPEPSGIVSEGFINGLPLKIRRRETIS